MQDKIFYSACFGFAVGVLVRSFISINFSLVFWVGVIAFAILVLFILFKNRMGVVFLVFVLAITIGVVRFGIREVVLQTSTAFTEVEFESEGLVIDAPDVRESNQKLTVEYEISGWTDKVFITTSLAEEYKYGDKINFNGKLKLPENFTTDQGKEFDYINYLKKDGILYVMNYPDIEILSRGHGNPIQAFLFNTKDKLLGAVNNSIQHYYRCRVVYESFCLPAVFMEY